ncbi:MAG: hypothetical protein HN413_00445 [Chloroflexi bacterium]|jgi:hypothetical protein|nr:hypothetical protein [Chloroflexota bacterium]
MVDATEWEYIVENFGGVMRAIKPEEFQAGLNELGAEGWEVIAVHQTQSSNKFWVFAKRPLSEAARRQRTRQQREW